MSATVFAMVMAAAFLHALWNALVKGADDKAAMLALIALGHVIPGVLLVAVSPAASWAIAPYIIASTVIHWFYYIGLNFAYRTGDLSVVYPIARGLAPLLIALGAWVWVGEALGLQAWFGIALISLGILALAVAGMRGSVPVAAILAATGVALTIAAYSLVDGVGVRVATTPATYIGWLFVAEIFVMLWMLTFRRARLMAVPPKTAVIGIAGGMVSGLAYALILYAQSLAPLGLVSALRETSVIFAALIGLIWFKEGPRAPRLLSAVIVGAGIVLLAK